MCGTLEENAHNLHDSAIEMVDSTTDQNAATQQLSESLENTNKTVDNVYKEVKHINDIVEAIALQITETLQMSKKVKLDADDMCNNAQQAYENGKQELDSTRLSVEHAIDSLNELSKINQLATEILSIANKTNLLSLNASIEAARAGEAGRGFAVVASEIRELSDSTKKLIVENNAKAEEIIPKINASIDSIKELIENINEMNEKVATIAATSEEISSQTSCVQSMADELRDAVENI